MFADLLRGSMTRPRYCDLFHSNIHIICMRVGRMPLINNSNIMCILINAHSATSTLEISPKLYCHHYVVRA